MVNTIWKEVFLIMCSHLKENARHSGRFPLVLRITDDYTLQMLCGDPHNICNEEGKMNGAELNRAIYSDDKEILDIIAGKFFIAYAPIESESFLSMPKDLMKKYEDKFRYPERFYQTDKGIEAKAYKPISKDMER